MPACKTPEHRPYWVVMQRECNHSAFNGHRRTPSAYSRVECTAPGCAAAWRTKAPYVAQLPDACHSCDRPADTSCRICRRPLCRPCLTNHHHEGYGTPPTDHR